MTAKTKNIVPVVIQDEMRDCYLDYAMSVIIGRALPDVRDGLKPVHRRSLFAMHALNLAHNKPYMKSARVVGDVIGKYHPHGDSAVYMTIARMAQDFSMRYPLVDGQGNFGSIDGDNPAAMRYTEVRMQKLSEEMLRDLDKATVDWQPNYDEKLQEPTVLPTKIPTLLINGSSGIAVGMATNIPPHNLTEVMTGLIALIKNPDLTIENLMDIIPGPDFPSAAQINGVKGIRKAYTRGKGIIYLRAKTEIIDKGKSQRIIVTELPYQVNKANLIEKIAELANTKTIEGIAGVKDLSNSRGKASIKIVIDLKRGENANVILNNLFKHTQLQNTFGINMMAIRNGMPKRLNLKEILQSFIDHRREVVVRRTLYLLAKARERAHLLEGMKIAVENIDRVVELIKAASQPAEAKTQLMDEFSLSEKQAQAILDLKLHRITGLERDKIVAEYQALLEEIAGWEAILEDESKVMTIIQNEFQEIIDAYGDDRRTTIIQDADEIKIEDMVAKEETLVTVTHRGNIKCVPVDTYKVQRRGGTGVKGASTVEDFFTHMFVANTHDTLMFFTTQGRLFTKKVHQLPKGTRTSKGKNVANIIPVNPEERVREIVVQPPETKDKFIVFATARGLVKKSLLSDYIDTRQGVRALKLKDRDVIVSVRITDGDKDILLCTTAGKVIRFSEEDAPPKGRVAQGSRGISLDFGEKVIGMEIVTEEDEILCITEKGYAKRTKVEEYRQQSRGGKGVQGMRLTIRNGNMVAIKPVQESDDLMIITNKGQVIRTQMKEIPVLGRTTQGVRAIKPKQDEKVVAVENVVDADD